MVLQSIFVNSAISSWKYYFETNNLTRGFLVITFSYTIRFVAYEFV